MVWEIRESLFAGEAIHSVFDSMTPADRKITYCFPNEFPWWVDTGLDRSTTINDRDEMTVRKSIGAHLDTSMPDPVHYGIKINDPHRMSGLISFRMYIPSWVTAIKEDYQRLVIPMPGLTMKRYLEVLNYASIPDVPSVFHTFPVETKSKTIVENVTKINQRSGMEFETVTPDLITVGAFTGETTVWVSF